MFQMNGVDIRKVMNTWTNQMGYPLVKVTMDAKNQVSASQSRFLLDSEFPSKTNFVSPYKLATQFPDIFNVLIVYMYEYSDFKYRIYYENVYIQLSYK